MITCTPYDAERIVTIGYPVDWILNPLINKNPLFEQTEKSGLGKQIK